jgi:hypothetical protein
MFITKKTVNVLCTASAATNLVHVIGGLLHAVRYTTATAENLATGSTCIIDVVGSSGASGALHEIVRFTGTSAAAMLYPWRERHTSAGATGALGVVPIPVAEEYVRIRVESGGASGRGQFDLFFQGR